MARIRNPFHRLVFCLWGMFLGTSVVGNKNLPVFNAKNGLNTGNLAGLAGFEPAEMPESKSGALPLGDSPICGKRLVSQKRNAI